MQKLYRNWSTLFEVLPPWPAIAKDPRDRPNCAVAQQAVHILRRRMAVHKHQQSVRTLQAYWENRNVNFTGKHFTYQHLLFFIIQ